MGSKSMRKTSRRLAFTQLFLALLANLLHSTGAQAQPATARKPVAVPPDTRPLARYVPKENLIVYFEFAGLDAHDDAWKKTSSYKMLNDTTLGEMLGAVSEQLLDKILTVVPDHRLSGGEIVTLVKHAARSGWVFALNADPKSPRGYRGTFVLRGGASKENRALTSKLMGWFMRGAPRPKIESKEGRSLIVVAPPAAQAQTATGTGWTWWAEKDDLVVGLMSPGSAESIIATLDGKNPSAVEHAHIKELGKSDGAFEPVCFGFADPAGATESSSELSTMLKGLKAKGGVDRLELRWGFEGEALLSVVRLVAAKPRKGLLATFDNPTFSKTTLIPMPDQIESFLATSINTRNLVAALKQIAPSSAVKDQIDEIAESIRTAGSIDLENDLLAHLGPRMVTYLAPGRSAATNDNSLESVLSGGWSPTAAIAALQSAFPKLTLVAEVNNPAAFSKALDAVIVALNNELKAQAIEKALEERKEAEKKDAGGGGGGRLGAAGGDRTKPRRSIQQTPAPRFQMMPSAEKAKLFILQTPSGSPLHLGPTSFRPTIELDGSHVVFAVSPEAARAALAAVKKKDWKPSSDLAKVCENVGDKLVLLGVNNVSDTLPPLLASLPGTLQTLINTSLTLAKSRDGSNAASPAAGQPGAPSGAQPRGMAMGRPGRGGGAAGGGPSMRGLAGAEGAGGGPSTRGLTGAEGASGAAGGYRPPGAGPQSGTPGSPGELAIVFNIDAEKLPKASDLKSHVFPSTIAISVTDQDIRIVSREAFPDFAALVGALPVAAMMPGVQAMVELSKAADKGQTQGASTGTPPSGTPAAAPPGGAAGKKAAAPGGRRKTRRDE
jgi:hypothetical protein